MDSHRLEISKKYMDIHQDIWIRVSFLEQNIHQKIKLGMLDLKIKIKELEVNYFV